MSVCRIIQIYPHITPLENSSLRVQRLQNKMRLIESNRIKSMITLNTFSLSEETIRRKNTDSTGTETDK